MTSTSARRTLLFAFATAALSCVLYFGYRDVSRVETGENVSRVRWLPKAACNVSYYRSYLNTAYEFDISEPDFVAWSRWTLTEIDLPVTIVRYTFFTRPYPTLPDDPTIEEFEVHRQMLSERGATVAKGLFHTECAPDGGGVWVAYDRTKQRAYFRSAPR